MLQVPPRAMDRSKLNCLCLIKSWVFRDGIIKMDKVHDMQNGFHGLKIKGDTIEESHLNEILDKERHDFILQEKRYNIYIGKFKPVEIKGIASLVPHEFEERLLSFAVDKSCGIIVCRISSMICIYFTDVHKHFPHFDGKSRVLKNCSNLELKERINIGDCREGRNKDLMNFSFYKYSVNVDLKNMTKEMKHIREQLRQYSDNIEDNILIFDIEKADGGPYKLYSCLNSKCFEVGKTDLVKLLRTGEVTLHKSGCSVSSKKINFANEEFESPYISYNLPEGARILQALADGRFRNPVIRFEQEVSKPSVNTDTKEYLEISLCTRGTRKDWKWVETNEAAILDFLSVPATAAPQEFDMFACCGNILELKGGRVRAEGMTILPGGNHFMSLSKRCLGIDSRRHDESTIPEKHIIAADVFCTFFMTNNELEYSRESVKLLCDVFHSLNGMEMTPWDCGILRSNV